ncbi:hypothetical protein AAFC00_006573 [Neodothiora populina]|uniref:RRM domain-containing protein n=1 Tax=Neodothiora populina TaxID=2781224 RepID=A0ABR3PBP3_9PEZI
MTSPNPPPEDPEYTSEPAVLSPVSPKPLHYPVPQNIPILEKQIDQAFNQTSAHMAQASVLQPPQQLSQAPSVVDSNQPPNVSEGHVPTQPMHQVQGGQIPQHTQVQEQQGTSLDNLGQMNYVPNEQASLQASTEPIPAHIQAQPFDHAHAQAHVQSEQDVLAAHHSTTNVTAQTPEYQQSSPLPAPAQAPALPSSINPAQDNPQAPPHAHLQLQNGTVEAAVPDVVNNSRIVQSQTELQQFFASFSQPITNAEVQSADGGYSSTTADAQPAPPGAASETAATATHGPPPGLPPKPPAQEQPSMHPHYDSSTDIRAYHPHSQHAPAAAAAQNSSYNAISQAPLYPAAPGQDAVPGVDSLPPPPVASFQSQLRQEHSESPTSRAKRQRELESQREIKQAAGEVLDDADVPWTPDTQRKYDVFLNEERKYVTEGNWEQFPHGSRLFVGNLSSERVTKRDIFHVFHRYGDLAQISIKQAYGFVQYLEPSACAKAMQVEQGKVIRGKKIHLEVSKPQKNRNTDTKGNRRSRSPENTGRGVNASVDRYQPSGQDRRREDRDRNRRSGGRGGREEFRRTPSPTYGRHRGSRDRSRDRYDSRYRSRSRSPYSRNRYRSPSPRRSEDDDLPLPRRRPGEVPDVQIIVLDTIDREFISYIERTFAARGIRVDVLYLSPRLSLDAVIKRQIMEGVQAVSQLTRLNQQTVKVPLQLYDRTNPANVRFDEYQDLDLNVAAELVLRAKSQAAAAMVTQNQPPPPPLPSLSAAPPPQYGYQGLPPPPPPPAALHMTIPPSSQSPNLSNLITSLDHSGLQKLLGAMSQQQPHSQHLSPPSLPPTTSAGQHTALAAAAAAAAAATGLTPDLAKLLAGNSVVAPPIPSPLAPPSLAQGFPPPPHGFGQQQQQHGDPLAALRANPALASLLSGQSPQQQQQQQPQQQSMPSSPIMQRYQQHQQPGNGIDIGGGGGGGGGGGAGVNGAVGGGGHDMAEILARLGNYGQQRR